MGYDNMHRITSKSKHLTQNNVQFNGTLNVGYDLTYTYGTEAGKKFQPQMLKMWIIVLNRLRETIKSRTITYICMIKTEILYIRISFH